MLVNFETIINIAKEKKFAIPAFNVYNMETVMGIMDAANELNAPVIMQVYPRLFQEECGYFLSPVILAAAKKATVPICFHLDHGPSELVVTRALRYGATGIMIDGSNLPLEENIALTKRVVDSCAYVGVGVEGELGQIKLAATDECGDLTEPEDAKVFVEQTGVTALAVMVGTAHGRYTKPPKIDTQRIKEIAKATNNTALVLHGGSGVGDDQIIASIEAGIRKINFATDICFAYIDEMLNVANGVNRPVAVDMFMKKPIEAVKNFAKEKIKLCKADGKA